MKLLKIAAAVIGVLPLGAVAYLARFVNSLDSGFAGQLLTADASVVRYRLLPLLRGRLEVERLSLEKPVLTLAADARGTWNYEKLGPTGAG